ncbi:MAG: sensor histidine kinase [Polaromonas sp.]
MDSRIQSDAKSKSPMRMGTRPPACRHFYGLQPIAEDFPVGTPVGWTESAQLQEERRAFSVAANAIREEEKARLARELHDELAQSLTALKMDTIWVRDNASCGPEMVAARMNDMVEMLDRTVAATRRIAADLRPLLLDDLGLVPAIEWLTSSFTQRCGIPCSLSIDKDFELKLPEPYATAVFRIVQESLANVAKHAAASQVAVTLGKSADTVVLVVQDNGCGFFTTAPRKPQSLGLMGLRERAQLLLGSVTLKSAPGQGTCVEVCIPLNQAGATQ